MCVRTLLCFSAAKRQLAKPRVLFRFRRRTGRQVQQECDVIFANSDVSSTPHSPRGLAARGPKPKNSRENSRQFIRSSKRVNNELFPWIESRDNKSNVRPV